MGVGQRRSSKTGKFSYSSLTERSDRQKYLITMYCRTCEGRAPPRQLGARPMAVMLGQSFDDDEDDNMHAIGVRIALFSVNAQEISPCLLQSITI